MIPLVSSHGVDMVSNGCCLRRRCSKPSVYSYFENLHATIPKGNMGYDQYTVPNLRSGVIYFVFAFLVLWLEREKIATLLLTL